MQHAVALVELRQFRRNPVRAYAFVHVHGGFQPVTIVDYSRGGLQLRGTFGLFQGNRVDIELMSGIRVPGRVAWVPGSEGRDLVLRTATRDALRHVGTSTGGQHRAAHASRIAGKRSMRGDL